MATSQNEALLMAVFRQLAVTKIDYGILGRDLGLSREAARNRWVRFQSKIMQSANSNKAASNDADMGRGQVPQTPSPKKTIGSPKGKTGSAKKRKRASSDDNGELGLDLGTGIERELDHQQTKSGDQNEIRAGLDDEAESLYEGELL